MKEDTRDKRWHGPFTRPFSRIALLVCLGLLMFGLGVAVAPPQAADAPVPPFSEQARAAALADTLLLRAAGDQLSQALKEANEPAPDTVTEGGLAALDAGVRLLTIQARALLTPGDSASETSPATAASSSPISAPLAAPTSAAELAAALAESGGQRLADAAVSDGGMARLLAAVGTAQLLLSDSLAVAGGTSVPSRTDASAPTPAGSCPLATATAGPGAGDGAGNASLHAALAAAAQTEAAAVYSYQVALTRLGGDAAEAASGYLARHEALLGAAESGGRTHCSPVPPRPAGYALDPEFLAAPASSLGALESAALPVYGDLVALSDGETRERAIAALLETARRAASWGARTGAVPGLTADPATFPSLPAPR